MNEPVYYDNSNGSHSHNQLGPQLLPRPFYFKSNTATTKHPRYFLSNKLSSLANNVHDSNSNNHNVDSIIENQSSVPITNQLPQFGGNINNNLTSTATYSNNSSSLQLSMNNNIQTIDPKEIVPPDLLVFDNLSQFEFLMGDLNDSTQNPASHYNNIQNNSSATTTTTTASNFSQSFDATNANISLNSGSNSTTFWSYGSEAEGAIATWLEHSVNNPSPPPLVPQSTNFSDSAVATTAVAPVSRSKRQFKKPSPIPITNSNSYLPRKRAKSMDNESYTINPLLMSTTTAHQSQVFHSQFQPPSSISRRSSYSNSSSISSISTSASMRTSNSYLDLPSSRNTSITTIHSIPNNQYDNKSKSTNNSDRSTSTVDIGVNFMNLNPFDINLIPNDSFNDIPDYSYPDITPLPEVSETPQQQLRQSKSQGRSATQAKSVAPTQSHKHQPTKKQNLIVPLPSKEEVESKLVHEDDDDDVEGDDEEDKYFLCPNKSCNKQFKRQEHLKRHQRSVHSGIKPYVCKICDKRFSRSDNLSCHVKTHKK